MKKSVLHVLCASLLLAGIPAQAIIDRMKSFISRNVSKVDYQTAVNRFNDAKKRFEAALKSHKKALITTAALALIAAVTAFVFSRSGGSSQIATGAGSEVGQVIPQENDKKQLQALLENKNGDVKALIGLLKKMVTPQTAIDSLTLSLISRSPIALNPKNRATLAQFFLSNESMNKFTGIYTDEEARAKARELFGPPQSSTTNAPSRYAAYALKR